MLNMCFVVRGALKKERLGGLGAEISTCMSEVLAPAVEALVPLRHKAVTGCLVKFLGLRCEPVPHVCLTSWSEMSRLPLRVFLETKNVVIAGREV